MLPETVIVPPRIAVYGLVAYPPCTVLSMSRVSPYGLGERVLASGVFEEQLTEKARVVSPFCCSPDSIKAVQNLVN